MKTLIFNIRQSTQEEIDESVNRNKGTKPWMYMLRLDYWHKGSMTEKPDGSLTCCRSSTIGTIIDSIKTHDKLL